MAFNPSPRVALARDFAKKFDKQEVIILHINREGKFGYASYGETKALCDEAKKLADICYQAIEEYYMFNKEAVFEKNPGSEE